MAKKNSIVPTIHQISSNNQLPLKANFRENYCDKRGHECRKFLFFLFSSVVENKDFFLAISSPIKIFLMFETRSVTDIWHFRECYWYIWTYVLSNMTWEIIHASSVVLWYMNWSSSFKIIPISLIKHWITVFYLFKIKYDWCTSKKIAFSRDFHSRLIWPNLKNIILNTSFWILTTEYNF